MNKLERPGRFEFWKQPAADRGTILALRCGRWAFARHYTYEQYWKLEREVAGTVGALLFAPFTLGCAALVVFAIVCGVALLSLFGG